MLRSLTMIPVLVLLAFASIPAVTAGTAHAQIPPPPATIYGSITDGAGEVEEGVVVEAFIDNNLCGTAETFYAGEGNERTTLYLIDVFSDGQQKGCGTEDALVRLRVGGASGKLAQKAIAWEAGLARFDIVFGENVTPKPIPTSTPTPPRPATSTPTPDRTLSPRTPGPSGASVTVGASPTNTSTGGVTGATATGTREDPVSSVGDDDDGGGFPLWGTVVLVIAGIAVIGGGIGLAMSRAQRAGEAGPPPSSSS